MNPEYYIGTSGWSYPKGEGTWNGYFYPPGVKNELEYYSQFFNAVEVNSSFYRPPSPGHVYNWARTTPKGFLFAVKLWQKFTHPGMYARAIGSADLSVSQADVDIFKKSIEPLVRYDRMGPLLIQFPPSFKNEPQNRAILDILGKSFGEYRLAVELRHKSWSDDSQTALLLGKHNMAWVQTDEPRFTTSISNSLPITADFAYFRFHGRNAENWWNGTVETRYRYLYSPDEILELTDKIDATRRQAPLTFAFFNNHWQGYAPRNALDILKALQLPLREFPRPLIPDNAPNKE